MTIPIPSGARAWLANYTAGFDRESHGVKTS
jgi:hypothetical protein